MNIYLDCEFTELTKAGDLISIGLVSDDNKQFYAESNEYDPEEVNEWVYDNVLPNLVHCFQSLQQIGKDLEKWFKQWDSVQIITDVGAWDWIMLCDLFDGAFNLPKHVKYIPLDLATIFYMKNIDPDISRIKFSDIQVDGEEHNALFDAKIIKLCFLKLITFPFLKGEN